MGQSPFWQQAGWSQHPAAVQTAAGDESSEAKPMMANILRTTGSLSREFIAT